MKKPRMTGALGLGAFFCVTLFFAASFFSCKSVQPPAEEKPVQKETPPPKPKINVRAFDTLSRDSIVYVRIPAKSHKAFTQSLLKSFACGASEKQISLALEKIDFVYIGAGSGADKERVQIACDGKLSALAKMGLSLSGVKKEERAFGGDKKYEVFLQENKIELCLPGSDLILISKDLNPQLFYFDAEAQRQIAAALKNATQTETGVTSQNGVSQNQEADGVSKNATQTETGVPSQNGFSQDPDYEKWLQSEAYNFVGLDKSEHIHIYIDKPVSFVTRLLGVALSSSIFRLNFIECEMKLLQNGRYSVDIDMEFIKAGFVPRALAFLNVAFSLADATAFEVDQTHLHVSGIQVSMEQLQKILGM